LPLPDTDVDPWETIQVDLFGPWTFSDKNGIDRKIRGVSIIDVGSRWVEIKSYDSKRSEDISLIIDQEWFARYPRPRVCIFDNGGEFSSEFLKLLHSYGVKAKPTTIKNPQANVFVERIHQVIADSLRTMDLLSRPFDDTTINDILQNAAFGLRATYHTSLLASPGQIVFGRDMIINSSYIANWKQLFNRRKEQAIKNNIRENKGRRHHDYKNGDNVYITNTDITRKLNSM